MMSRDPVLHLLGLARKAGRLEVGEEPVGAVCRARQAKLVLIADNAAPNTYRRAAHFGEAGNVLWLSLPHSKEELGFTLGRSSCAMLALTDVGFASALVKKLAQRDPERYAAAALQLDARAQKALQRQREMRQHEKNLRQGKRKPWAPPPPPRPEGTGDAAPKTAKPAPKAGAKPGFRPGPKPGAKPGAKPGPKSGPAGRRMQASLSGMRKRPPKP